jgi:NTE family protein
MIKNIVFSGAGVKIYSFLGFIKALNEFDLLSNIESFIGTSSGSLIATLCAINFKYIEIEEILLKINMSSLKNINTENIMSFFNDYGADDGEKFSRIIKIIFQHKFNNENITFKELYEITNKNLIITATCVNTMDIEYFDYEKTPNIPVLTALIMSISIPIIFKPVKFGDKYYVDGGLIKHYPIDYFKNSKENTLGILVSTNLNTFTKINNIQDYIYNVMNCPFMNLVKNCYDDYKDNTILIEDNTNFIDFDIEYNTKINLIDNAYNATKKHLESLVQL